MVVIGPTGARSTGNLSELEGGQMYLPEQIKHELADLSGSQAGSSTKNRRKFERLMAATADNAVGATNKTIREIEQSGQTWRCQEAHCCTLSGYGLVEAQGHRSSPPGVC